jgi:hypothetical protein
MLENVVQRSAELVIVKSRIINGESEGILAYPHDAPGPRKG